MNFLDLFKFFRPAPWEEGAAQYSCILKDEDKAKKETNEFVIKRKRKNIKLITVKNPGPLDPPYEPTEELIEHVKKDSQNSRKWEECLEMKVRKDKWYKHVEEVILLTLRSLSFAVASNLIF